MKIQLIRGDLFLSKGRINRIDFLNETGQSGILHIFMFAGLALSGIILNEIMSAIHFNLNLELTLLFTQTACIISFCIDYTCRCTRRWHDINRSGWYNFLSLPPLTPFTFLALILIPGKK